jgi:Tol biopolymer transport system component
LTAGEPYAVKTPDGIGLIGNTDISWMPDNETVVFGSIAPGRYGVHLMSLNTSTGTVRALPGGGGYAADADVSPDGNFIAFTSGGPEYDLVEFSVAGGEPRAMLATGLVEQGATWHPNGNEFVFSRRGLSGHSKLFSRTRDGSWERPVLPAESHADQRSYYSPAYSPDGQRIVYEKHGLEGHILHVSLVSGTRSVRIDKESDDQHGPVWSPDGSWILYARQRRGLWELAQVRSDGSGAPATLTTEGVGPAGATRAVWSPSGELIAYASSHGLRVMRRDGKPRVLTAEVPALFAFSKTDKELIALRRVDRHTARTVSIDTSTGLEKVLGQTHLPAQTTVSGLSLHPSGASFLTTTSTSREDVWVLERESEPSGWRRWFGRR